MVVRECLEVKDSDTVLVVADYANREIGDALLEAARDVSRSYLALLEDFTERPAREYPWPLREYVEWIKPTVSIYTATVQPGELPLRKGYVEHVTSLGAKHAHMPGVNKEIFRTGLRSCKDVEEVTERVYDILVRSRDVEVRTDLGTELYVRVGRYRWVKDTGRIAYGEWGNLPGGEVFTTPESVEGIAVVDGCLGDYFKKYGRLKEPVTFVIEGSELVDVRSENEDLAAEVWKYLSEAENGVRVGEFAVGTNVNVTEIIGNLLQDEKHPGVHIAFGDPLGEKTGAEWESSVHVDGVITKTDVVVDGRWLMRRGTFVFE